MIQVFFFKELTDNLFKNKEINCYDLKYSTPEYKQCHKSNDEENNIFLTRKFIFMMIMAILIFIIITKINMSNNDKYGIGLGALFMIFYALCMHWTKMNKILILGTSLLILLNIVSKIMENKKIL